MTTKNRKLTNFKKQEPMTPEEQKALETLLKDIRDFVGNNDYFFRGEPEEYKDVSSNLYREYEKAAKVDIFSIHTIQSNMLARAKKHIKEEDDDAILEQLQHYGGKTNQIDFTTDYFIALFFACEAEPEKDGRLIFLKEDVLKKQGKIYEPKNPQNRVIAQKSIFFRPHSGVIETDNIISIGKELKKTVLFYLDKHHNITPESIYNDIHGFIDRNRDYEDRYTHLYRGHAYYNDKNYKDAIEHYTEALNYEGGYVPLIYNSRGNAYNWNGEHALAIADYTKAIGQNSPDLEAYYNRGIAKVALQDFKGAKEDYETVLELSKILGKQATAALARKKLDNLPADSDS